MRRNYGGGSYRGRADFRTILKAIIAILVLVLVLMVGAYFFLQQFAVITDDGVRFDLPFFQGKDPSPEPEPTIVVETPPAVITPPPTPKPEPVAEIIHAVSLPRTALYDGTAQTQVEAAGGNTALFDMKADDGTLGYLSAVQAAKELKTSDSNPAINAAIQALTGGELRMVARVSCFRDNTAPYRNNNLAIKTYSGYNWKDPAGIRWTSPTNEAVRQYLTEICVELAQLGFDEILLDNAGYPTQGKLGNIKPGAAYDTAQLSTVISAFYAQVKTSLAPYPEVKLSIVGYEGALDGTDLQSGQTAAALAENAQRIWIAPPAAIGGSYLPALTAAGMKDPAAAIVTLSPQGMGQDLNWAVWPMEP